MAKKPELPKKILCIKNLTFILPDDFSGNLEDALIEFIEYRKRHKKNALYLKDEDDFTTTEILLAATDGQRVCGEYGLFELNDNKDYILIEGSAK